VGLPCFAYAAVTGRAALSHWFFVAGFVGIHARCAECGSTSGLLGSDSISALDSLSLTGSPCCVLEGLESGLVKPQPSHCLTLS